MANVNADLSLFVLPFNTNFMNKLKFNDFKNKKNALTENFSLIYKIIPLSTQGGKVDHLSERKRVLW